MQFAYPEILYAAAAAVLATALFLWWAERRTHARLRDFAASPLLADLAASASPRRRAVKAVLTVLAVALLGTALARPQWGVVYEETEGRGVDIMIALDTSRSMLAEDVRPNRLERAKLSLNDLVDNLRGDRVGLLAFAGRAFLQVPLTLDYDAFRNTLAIIDTDIIPVPGTDIGGAIREARMAMRDERNHRILVLITDGEDLEARARQETRRAAAEGFVIYTVGVGTPEGARIPVTQPDGTRDYHRDINGEIVVTRLDEDTLIDIAAETGGVYMNLGAGEGLEAVYARIIETIPPEDLGTRLQAVPIERYQWFAVLALALLAVERLISTRRRRPAPSVPAAAALLFAILLALPAPAQGDTLEGRRLFERGEFAASAEAYARALERRPDDASLHYNKGVNLYRAGDYTAARRAFDRALSLGPPDVQERAFFNLGNTLYRLGERALDEGDVAEARDLWAAALDNYGNTLELNPEAADAAANEEAVRRDIATITRHLRVAVHPPEGGTVEGGGAFARGYEVPVRARANDGWRFGTWAGDGIDDPESEETTVTLDQDREIAAVFVKVWNLTVESADPELGTAGTSGVYDEGADIPVEAEAFDYYAFTHWEGEGLEVDDPEAARTTVRLSQDARVRAHFVDAYRLDLSVEPEIGGFVWESGFFRVNSDQPILAQPRGGFRFEHWRGEGASEHAAPETTVAMTEDRRLTAVMEREWSLILIPVEEDSGFVEGGGDFPVGTRTPINAVPNEGFTFEQWEGPGVEDPFAESTHVTVRSTEHDLYAIFRREDSDDDDDSEDEDESQENSPESDPDGEPDDDERDDDSDRDEDEPEAEEPEAEDEQPEDEEEPADEEEREDEAEPEPEDAAEEPAPETPVGLTPEEADQILNLLDPTDRILPLTDDTTDPAERRTGRDW